MLKIAEDNGETTKQDAIDNAIPSASRSRGSLNNLVNVVSKRLI